MKLPDHVAHAYYEVREREPLAAARALYDLNGNLGQTFVVADPEGLMIFSQPLNGPMTRHSVGWGELTGARIRTETAFAFLELHTSAHTWKMPFSSWQGPELEKIIGLWREHHRVETTSAPREAVVPTPLTLFCAAIHAMIQCDQCIEPVELQFLSQRVPDPEAIRRGHALLQQQGMKALGQPLRDLMSEEQRRCLLANLMSVAMVDGALQSEELELLTTLQSSLGIDQTDYDRIWETLLTRNNLSVFADTTPEGIGLPESDGLRPLLGFCAAMVAMMECDSRTQPEEELLLSSCVPYPEEIEEARRYLGAHGLDHLLRRLPAILNPAQRACLMANLISLVMADGYIRGAEGALLERFQRSLDIPDEDHARMYEVLLLKDNLGVFAEKPAT